MGWVDQLRGKVVGVDTAPFIYFIEDHAQFADRLEPFFQAVDSGEIMIVSSVITLTEVLTQPLRLGDEGLAQTYEDFLFSSTGVTLLPVGESMAQLAAELRAVHRLKTPDAIQLATALSQQATAFLTNDRDYGTHQEIEILRLCDLVE